MKTITTLLFTFGLLLSMTAQDSIKVEVRFIEHPADLVITKDAWQSGELLKQRGVVVLRSGPACTTTSGRLASIKAVDVRSVPSGGKPTEGANWQRKVEAGAELQVQPVVRGDSVDFSATATIRQFEGVEGVGDVAFSQYSSREFYFGGTAKSGETLVLPWKATGQSKRVTLVVTFTQTTVDKGGVGGGGFGGDAALLGGGGGRGVRLTAKAVTVARAAGSNDIQQLSLYKMSPNLELQRTRHDVVVCNPHVPWAGSLRLGR